MEASCGVKDSSAMMQFEWKVSDIVFKESVLTATETLKFGSKVNSPKQSQKITKNVSYLVLLVMKLIRDNIGQSVVPASF